MPEQEGYEVLRFVERGVNCYASTDYVKGTTLYDWIKENTTIEKETLHMWIEEIVKQLDRYHKQHGNPGYHFLNPYNIIITEKSKIVLVSGEKAQKNKNKFVEKHFTPVNENQNDDIYCLGKTIQFIMAHIECKPSLTKKEEYRLLKIVHKCLEESSKNQYTNIQSIQNYILKGKRIKLSEIKQKKLVKPKVVKAAIIFGLCFLLVCYIGEKKRRAEVETLEVIEEAEAGNTEEEIEKENKVETEGTEGISEESENVIEEGTVKDFQENQYFDIALTYFLELKNYDKSREFFMKAADREAKAGYYAELADFMLKVAGKEKAEPLLELLKEEIMREAEPDVREMLILIRGYILCDTEAGYQAVIELSKKIEIETDWNSLTEEVKKEFYENQAAAYKKLEKQEETGQKETGQEEVENILG